MSSQHSNREAHGCQAHGCLVLLIVLFLSFLGVDYFFLTQEKVECGTVHSLHYTSAACLTGEKWTVVYSFGDEVGRANLTLDDWSILQEGTEVCVRRRVGKFSGIEYKSKLEYCRE